MGKIMPLDLLASIKGASSSEAVNELFEVIRRAIPEEDKKEGMQELHRSEAVNADLLRDDEVAGSSESEKEIIRKNFPGQKNGFLVVPKVIED
jgi:Asp-tRNA(Asn)/Glu-tRNA(Gln) amidotransferase C subunit